MHVILLGGLFFLGLIATLAGIILARERGKGCPQCGRDSGLRVLRYRLWSAWLSQFNGSVHRAQCLHCKWKGLMKV